MIAKRSTSLRIQRTIRREARKLSRRALSLSRRRVFLSIRVRKRYSLSVCHARATRLSATTFLFGPRDGKYTHTHTERRTVAHTESADRWTSFGREMIHLPRGTKLHLRSFIRTWVFTRDSDSSRHNSFLHLCNRKRKYTPGKFEPVTFLSDSFDPLRWTYKRFFPPLPSALLRVGLISRRKPRRGSIRVAQI